MVNPYFEGLSARYSWMAVSQRPTGNAPLQAIKKLDLLNGETSFWSVFPRGFVSEPLFVPRPKSQEEDEGWILVLIWNGKPKSTELTILESKNLNEIARMKLPICIPHGLHGSWSSS